jgi:hypothetical protein
MRMIKNGREYLSLILRDNKFEGSLVHPHFCRLMEVQVLMHLVEVMVDEGGFMVGLVNSSYAI